MILACSMLSAIATRRVKPLDGDEGKPRASLEGYTGDVYSIAWSPNGKLLATGSDDRTVKLWDAATGKMLCRLTGHTDSICSVAWSPNGKTLASSAGDATLKLWDLDTGKLLSSLRGHTGGVYTVAWSPDGKTLASGSDDRTVKLWMALWARNGFDKSPIRSIGFKSGGWTIVSWRPPCSNGRRSCLLLLLGSRLFGFVRPRCDPPHPRKSPYSR